MESFVPYYKQYLNIAEKGVKLPSKKELRMMDALRYIGQLDN